MKWRAAEPRDDGRILDLVDALYTEDPSDAPIPRSNAERTLAALRADPVRGMAVVVETPEHEIVGYALLISFWSNEYGGEVCEIDELYVAPSHRGKGLASMLIEALARGEGPWGRIPVALTLVVTPDNARAFALYERLGFTRAKNVPMRMRASTRPR